MDEPTDVLRLPAWRVLELYRAGELRPTEYVERSLRRIEALEPRLRAFVTVVPEAAMAEAARVEADLAHGRPTGALAGLPVAVKDEVETAGIRTTVGSAVYEHHVPDVDATVVRRLREEGAAIIGKTNLPEFASHPRCWNPIAGDTRNPFDPSRVPGSSSGGSGVAVATGMAPLAIGSDGGGSTRIPSAHCGTVGLHPTRGIVSSHGVLTSSPTSSLGPMARTVRDVALLLDVMAGYDPLDTSGTTAEPRGPFLAALDAGVRGLRAAWSPDLGHLQLADPRPMEQAHAAALALAAAGLGTTLEEPGLVLDYTFDLLAVISMGVRRWPDRPLPPLQLAEALARAAAVDPERRSPHLRPTGGLELTEDQHRAARARLAALRRHLDEAFARYDVLLTPTMAEPAPHIPDDWPDDVYRLGDRGTTYLGLVNLTDGCAASVPCGFVDGVPVGIQVVGPSHAEAKVLRVAQALEDVLADDLAGPIDRMWASLA